MTLDHKSEEFDLDNWNIQDAILLNHKKGFDALFEPNMGIDDRNSSRYIISVSLGGFCTAVNILQYPKHM